MWLPRRWSSSSLLEHASALGLPPFIQSFLVANIQYENDCLGETTAFSVSTSETVVDILWDFGDGQTSTLVNPTNTYNAAGNYTVQLVITTPNETQTFTTDVTIFESPTANTPSNIDVCDDNNDGVFDFDFDPDVTNEVLGSQLAADFNVLYFTSQADADAGSNPISLPFSNTSNAQQIFVRIENVLNTTCYDTTSFIVEVFDTPTANVVDTLSFCDDGVDGSLTNGQMDVDLSAATTVVLGSQSPADFNVTYHLNQNDADTNTNALPLTFYNSTPFAQTIFVRIENVLNTDCFDTSSFVVEVFATPTANTPSNIDVCDDNNDGVFDFDFDPDVTNEVLGSQLAADFNVLYFTSQADADAGSNPISLPFSNTSNAQQIFVRIENVLNTTCYDTTSFIVEVFDTPTANVVDTLSFCDDGVDGSLTNGQMDVDLSAATTVVLGSQSPADFNVTYHLNQNDADTNTNALPLTFYNSTPFAQTIFVRIENVLNTDCFDTSSFVVEVFATPTANTPSNIDVCDDNNDGVFDFDFDPDVTNEVLGSQLAADFNVLYFTSQADADAGSNPISLPFSNTSNAQQIFVRIENVLNTTCYDTTSFIVEVFDTPTANVVDTLSFCDDGVDGSLTNGQMDVDLSAATTVVLGSQSPADFNVTYHLNQNDADTNTNALPLTFYNSTPFAQTIFVRIENVLNTDCFDTSSFVVEVNPIPDSFNSSLFQCDEDGFVDGFTIFNCHEADDVLTGNITGLSTAFYLTMADAQSSSNPINGNNFPNTSNPQTLYVQVIDDASGCFSISQLELEVSTTDVSDALLVRCDDDGTEDGLASFDLTQADSMVLVGAPTGVTITYYASNQDALLEQNPLISPFVNTSPYSQNIYARAEDDNACYGISQVLLQVNPLPILQDDQTIIYCLNTFPAAINLNAGVIGGGSGLSYSWNTGEATEDIQVNQAGVYRVTVENANGCSQQRQITVVASDTATIENIVVTDASEQNAIAVFVSGVGNYEFALDNPLGNYQNIGFFDQVSPGIHTVYVRDINGCGITQEMVSVIGFMKFFTPNGDGFNDTWQVIGLSSQFQPDSKIIIYDRYGKLITLITPEHSGWDGTYNGYKMPASDYWFQAILQDGRSFKGHFTLKR